MSGVLVSSESGTLTGFAWSFRRRVRPNSDREGDASLVELTKDLQYLAPLAIWWTSLVASLTASGSVDTLTQS